MSVKEDDFFFWNISSSVGVNIFSWGEWCAGFCAVGVKGGAAEVRHVVVHVVGCNFCILCNSDPFVLFFRRKDCDEATLVDVFPKSRSLIHAVRGLDAII